MGMQIATTMTMGSGAPAASQEPVRGRRMPSPMDQNTDSAQTDSGQLEAAVSASQRSESMDLDQTTSNIEQMNHAFDRRLQFVVDQESRDITVKVIDRETDTVIKVLPPEELQRLNNGIRETMGVLFNRTV